MTRKETNDAWTRLDGWLKANFVGYLNHTDQVDIPGAGKGLVATSIHKSLQPLLVIPSSSLLNPLTLLAHPDQTIPHHLIPLPTHSAHREKRRRISLSQRSLNTTQLLTLHVLLTRDKEGRHCSPWEFYLCTVPQDFGGLPLVWAVKGDKRLDRAPESGRLAVGKVRERFEADVDVLKDILANEEPFKSQDLQLGIDDYLWAWLIVNTRSVSIPLGYSGPTELYNHSLVPILDLANHSPSPSILKPRQTACPSLKSSRPIGRPHIGPLGRGGKSINGPGIMSHAKGTGMGMGMGHLVPGRIAFQLLAPEEGLKEGEELTFEYHAMGNTEMWAEYGFAESPGRPTEVSDSNGGVPTKGSGAGESPQLLPPSSKVSSPREERWTTMKYSSVSVNHLVAALWKDDPEKRLALEKINCWEHNTLHPYPTFEASHGLLMSLRVSHLDTAARGKLDPISLGRLTFVSEESETLVRKDLRDMCEALLDEVRIWKESAGEGNEDAMVGVLWEEQESVARGCLAVYSSPSS